MNSTGKGGRPLTQANGPELTRQRNVAVEDRRRQVATLQVGVATERCVETPGPDRAVGCERERVRAARRDGGHAAQVQHLDRRLALRGRAVAQAAVGVDSARSTRHQYKQWSKCRSNKESQKGRRQAEPDVQTH